MIRKLIILSLIAGCANNSVSNISSALIDIFILDDKCKSIIYRYNKLLKENKKLVIE